MSSFPVDADSSAPSDNTTLTEVLEGYANAGFTGSFSAMEGATIECHECMQVSAASDVSMTSLRRLEGASDPDDMFAVVAIECPKCSRQGTLILGFGPNAPAEDGDVLKALRDQRADSGLPGNSAPGEAHGDDSEPTS